MDLLHALTDLLIEKETVMGSELDDLIAEMRPDFDFFGRKNVKIQPKAAPADAEDKAPEDSEDSHDPEDTPAVDETIDDEPEDPTDQDKEKE